MLEMTFTVVSLLFTRHSKSSSVVAPLFIKIPGSYFLDILSLGAHVGNESSNPACNSPISHSVAI